MARIFAGQCAIKGKISIYGERIWATQADCGIVLLVWGLVALEVWPTVAGVTLVVLAQLWRIDRLVWMYDELLTCR